MAQTGMSHLLDPDGLPLFSIKEINELPQAQKESIYSTIVPAMIFEEYGFDRQTFTAPQKSSTLSENRIKFICPQGLGLLRIEIRRDATDQDCLFFVEVADTPYRQIELSFCLINDPDSPRFNIDHDEQGRENSFATVRRNIPEEIKAMNAGLSPNQVRRGLKAFKDFFAQFEKFVVSLGIEMIIAEPLSYSNAVRYENYGFDYITGKQLMLWIDREFQFGGVLTARLDGSTPFRQQGMEATVRGRSWAIHDGILDQPWDEIKIYKTVGQHAGINTVVTSVY
ncbi:MAG: hypothetical protein BA874_09335 [Desulfuromonadales bacterium C00003068]|jgi:hypothetical protein|nr:hypothetical protein [Deltaproteobacteria bacterium]OEU75597.1 MAG: hypothetical protein BA874_09335 [Desulfuromonadales bacterium C00003068]